MACVFARSEPPWLLILDAASLRRRLVVVSHDQAFLRNIGITREIAL
jgi:hypothetical protein